VTVGGFDGESQPQNRKPAKELKLPFRHRRQAELLPEAIPVKILYEDDDLLVIDKPAGLTVHPAPGHPSQYSGECCTLSIYPI